MKIFNESKDLQALNELFVDVQEGLPSNIENSIYYPKIRHLLFGEINTFCKEQVELKQDLNVLRMMVGEVMTEDQIREYLDRLMLKYNNEINNVGLVYHIEQTKLDYGVPVVVIIKRGSNIFVKKLVYRFKKNINSGIGDLNSAGMLKKDITNTLANSKLKKKDGEV